MTKTKVSRFSCSHPGCTVKRSNYGIRGRRTCARHCHYTLDVLEHEVSLAGATLDRGTERAGFVNVDAPTGKRWAASGTHALCVNFADGGFSYGDKPNSTMLHEAIVDVFERMDYGLEDCDDPECDICHESEA